MNSKDTVAYQLGRIRDLLELTTSIEVADLLRNPGESYPDGALVRLMLSKKQEPSERFAALVEARLAEVESQLTAGLRALDIAGRVRRVFIVTAKRHLIDLLSPQDIDRKDLTRADGKALVTAALAVPADMLSVCRICRQPFIRRSVAQTVCRRTDDDGRYECVRKAERVRRQARKGIAHAEV
jgi:hypothetical protein